MATFFRLLLGYMWDCFRSHERLKAEAASLSGSVSALRREDGNSAYAMPTRREAVSGGRTRHIHLTSASVFPHQLFGSRLSSELLGIKPRQRGRKAPLASK
jgi:hypothetical protein